MSAKREIEFGKSKNSDTIIKGVMKPKISFQSFNRFADNTQEEKRLIKVSSMVIENKNKLVLENKKKEKVFADLMAKHNQLYRKWRVADLVSAILALLGLFLALIEFEIGFELEDDDTSY